jgi:hypothetical protein
VVALFPHEAPKITAKQIDATFKKFIFSRGLRVGTRFLICF